MLVLDTSAFVSLGVGGVLDTVLAEFDTLTTETVLDELRETAAHDDPHGRAAEFALDAREEFRTVDADGGAFTTSRIDAGEASCVAAVRRSGASFLVTDDYRALPELEPLVTDAEVALSPIVLRALVKRDALDDEAALAAFDRMAETRDWLGGPIHRYGRRLLD